MKKFYYSIGADNVRKQSYYYDNNLEYEKNISNSKLVKKYLYGEIDSSSREYVLEDNEGLISDDDRAQYLSGYGEEVIKDGFENFIINYEKNVAMDKSRYDGDKSQDITRKFLGHYECFGYEYLLSRRDCITLDAIFNGKGLLPKFRKLFIICDSNFFNNKVKYFPMLNENKVHNNFEFDIDFYGVNVVKGKLVGLEKNYLGENLCNYISFNGDVAGYYEEQIKEFLIELEKNGIKNVYFDCLREFFQFNLKKELDREWNRYLQENEKIKGNRPICYGIDIGCKKKIRRKR